MSNRRSPASSSSSSMSARRAAADRAATPAARASIPGKHRAQGAAQTPAARTSALGSHHRAGVAGAHAPRTSAASQHTNVRAASRSASSQQRRAGAAPGHAAGAVQAPVSAVATAKQAAHNPRSHAPGARARRGVVIGGMLVGFALAALLIYIVGGALINVMLHDDRASGEEAMLAADAGTDAGGTQTRTVALAADNDTIDYLGYTYSLVEGEDGSVVFASQLVDSTAEPLALFTVSGTPVGFAWYDGFFYVVSNTDDGYVIQSFMPGDGSMPVDFLSGSETVTSLVLEGSELTLEETGGRTYVVNLADGA